MSLGQRFLDARSIPHGYVLETDVCIVGAGAAGITLALEFMDQPFRVCLLESGGLEFDSVTQSLAEGKNIGLPYHALDTARIRYFGGSTNHWGGTLRPLDTIDFEEREWVPWSGWPFPKTHLDSYYERAQAVSQLGPYKYEFVDWEKKVSGRPLFQDDRLAHSFFQFTPHHFSFGREYAPQLAAAGNMQTLLYANAVELESDRDGSRVQRLRVATLQGSRFWVSARLFIVAAGGVENARLLLASNRVRAAGLGNEHDLVGRFFADHTAWPIGVLLPSHSYLAADFYQAQSLERTAMLGIVRLSEPYLRREKLLNSWTRFYPTIADEGAIGDGVASFKSLLEALRQRRRPLDLRRHLTNVLLDLDLVAKTYSRRAAAAPRPVALLEMSLHSDTFPNPQSRVTLSRERDSLGMNRTQLDWRLMRDDVASVRRTAQLLAEACGASGLGRARILLDPEDDWPIPGPGIPWRGPRGQFHHMGTTRIHNDPKRGVVDENCRVHSVPNLYIAGSSVFPTYGYATPTLTIVALAIRLADHVKKVLRGRAR